VLFTVAMDGKRQHIGSVMEGQDIRIALIHPNKLFRECLSYYLSQAVTIGVVYTASQLEKTEEQLTLDRPDIIVLGFDVFNGYVNDQFVGNRALPSESKRLVIEVPETEEDVIYCIEKVGAHGYLHRGASSDDLLSHIRAIMNGETLCSPRIANLVFCRMSNLARRVEELGPVNGKCLTKREAEIAELIENGLSNKEIAVRLHVEVSTVKNHVHNILDKLKAHDRRSAVQHLKEQKVA
jgi:two-component system, NarL family, nitrate/nitrite response regulator NarL